MSCGADEVAANSATNAVADLGTVVVEGSALSKYRPETVDGATFTDLPPEKSPTVVDTLTEDFIREHNPTDLHDLLRYVPGVETGGKSLLIRQPGTFQIRGMGGTEPAFDGVVPIGTTPSKAGSVPPMPRIWNVPGWRTRRDLPPVSTPGT